MAKSTAIGASPPNCAALGVPLRDRSDTEVLFQLIRREGVRRAVERIDGMFAFAFRDGATGTLYLVRDRFGEKPLYYGIGRAEIVFASEVSALQRHPAFSRRGAGPGGGVQFPALRISARDADRDGRASSSSNPARILTVKGWPASRIERYWRPHDAAGRPPCRCRAEAVDRLDELLAASVRDRVVADVPVGVFLSGGLDSSLITACAAKASPDLTAFTVRVGQDSFDETASRRSRSRAISASTTRSSSSATRICSPRSTRSPTKLGEPLANSSLLPTYLVCRAARGLMTVALGGDGADELFLGYPNFAVQRFAGAMRLVPAARGPTRRARDQRRCPATRAI